MHITMTVLSLAMLIQAGPASAQATHTATVSVHRDLKEPLSSEQVSDILEAASKALKKDPGDQACPVTFKLEGPIGRFGSKKQPAVIKTRLQRDAVHAVDAHKDATFQIKVVKAIHYCVGSGENTGCAYPARLPSIIVVHPGWNKDKKGKPLKNDHILWAHEFGHLTGLSHRDVADRTFLMTGCSVTAASVKVTEAECGCLLAGPEGCGNPTPKRCPR